MLRYYLYKIGKYLALNLPSKQSYLLAQFFSDLHYFFHFRDRQIVQKNLKRIVGSDQKIAPLTRQMFRNFGRYLVEFFCMDKNVSPAYIDQFITVKNLHYIEKVLAHQKGGIILTAHLGNWELGALTLSELGFPMTVIALPHKEKSVNSFFNEQRESKGGLKIVPTNIAIRNCLKQLKSNQLIAVVGDRDFFQHGEVLPFLEEKALLPKGPAAFSFKTGAPIIPVFFTRAEEENYELSVCRPIYPETVIPDGCEEDKAIKILMKEYIPVIESQIRKYPDQWMMFRDYAWQPG